MTEANNRRRLKITACRPVHTGTTNKGQPYTIYEIGATQENAAPLPAEMKLRSFAELPIGEVIEVEVSRHESERYGVSYTLTPPKGTSSGKLNEVLERMTNLEAVMQQLAGRVKALEDRSQNGAAPLGGAPAGVPSVPGVGDDSIPFAPSLI